MINSLIIDDQKAAIALLSDYARYSDINVVDTFTNPLEAIEFVLTVADENRPNLPRYQYG